MPHVNCVKRPYHITCKNGDIINLEKGSNKVKDDELDSLKATNYFNQLLDLGFIVIELSKKKLELKKLNKE